LDRWPTQRKGGREEYNTIQREAVVLVKTVKRGEEEKGKIEKVMLFLFSFFLLFFYPDASFFSVGLP